MWCGRAVAPPRSNTFAAAVAAAAAAAAAVPTLPLLLLVLLLLLVTARNCASGIPLARCSCCSAHRLKPGGPRPLLRVSRATGASPHLARALSLFLSFSHSLCLSVSLSLLFGSLSLSRALPLSLSVVSPALSGSLQLWLSLVLSVSPAASVSWPSPRSWLPFPSCHCSARLSTACVRSPY